MLVPDAARERLIDALLTLATSEQGIERREPFDPAAVAAQCWPGARSRPADTTCGSRRGSRRPRWPAIRAWPKARRPSWPTTRCGHNRPGGQVTVETGSAFLSVRNTGRAVPPEKLDRLAGQRLGHADRPGPRLAIVAAHGGELRMSAPAGGPHVTVCFPPPT